jgi:hypothetical protein
MTGFLTAWDEEAHQPREVPASDAIAIGLTVLVEDGGRMLLVSPAEAAAGMQRYGRSLGLGTPACGEWERKALEITGHPWQRKPKAATRKGKSGT